jgi:hypothetical protein
MAPYLVVREGPAASRLGTTRIGGTIIPMKSHLYAEQFQRNPADKQRDKLSYQFNLC